MELLEGRANDPLIFHFRTVTSSWQRHSTWNWGTSYDLLFIWPKQNIQSTDFGKTFDKGYHHLSDPSSATSFSGDPTTYWFKSQHREKRRWSQQLIPNSKFGQQSRTYAYQPSSLQASWKKWQHHEHQEQPANNSDYIIMKFFVIF